MNSPTPEYRRQSQPDGAGRTSRHHRAAIRVSGNYRPAGGVFRVDSKQLRCSITMHAGFCPRRSGTARSSLRPEISSAWFATCQPRHRYLHGASSLRAAI
jgi:hypothetical protein